MTKLPKVLLVAPRIKSMFGGKNVPAHPHVGIAYLISYLAQNNFPVSVVDEGVETGFGAIENKIRKFRPDIIGVTMFSYCYDQACKIIDSIKKKHRNIPVIIGGPHVSAVRKKALTETGADFAIYGEGEIALADFLKEFGKGNKANFKDIPNLIWRNAGRILENQPAKLITDLDNLPFPDYEAFRLKKYTCWGNKILPILTSRGCPYGCNYCSVRLSMGRGFRPRSPSNVVSEIIYWHRKGFNSFDINDDCFTLDMDRAEKICDEIIRGKIAIKFQLYNGIRVDRVTPKLLKKLRKAGCTFIAYGCEAGNDRMLRVIGKGITLAKVKRAVDWTNEAGIKNAVNFIIGHAGESYRDAMDSIQFAKTLESDFVNFYNLVPYPGTEAYKWVELNGRFIYPKEEFLRHVSYRDNVPIFETDDFTKEQREDIMRKGFSLYEKKVLQFRLGKNLGLAAYAFTRFPILRSIGLSLLVNNKIAHKIFTLMSKRSRE